MLFSEEQDRTVVLGAIRNIFCKAELKPIVFCDLDKEMVAFETAFNGDADKESFTLAMQMMIRTKRITGFCFAAESWATHIPDSQKHLSNIYMRMPAKSRPYTHEIILVTFSNASTELCFQAKITNKKDGSRVLGEWESMSKLESGRFAHLWAKATGINN